MSSPKTRPAPGFKSRAKQWVDRIAAYVLDGDAHDIKRVLQRRALDETADFVASHMPLVTPYPDRFALYEATLKQVTIPGMICEFGVFKGESINYIAEILSNADVYGFDSFEGLPEDWRAEVKAGHFKMQQLPAVRPNVRLVQGWFDKSLPAFLENHPEPAAYLHIDSDLYSSAKTILDLFASRIRPGTVIVFDEFFNYPGWRQGEYKAFEEFVAAHGTQFDYIGYSARDEQAAIVIK
jgi:predicted O-methyltransferase YrrM